MKKILVSPRTALTLMGFIGVSCCTASFVPQITERSPAYFEAWSRLSPLSLHLADSLRLNRVYTSFWFLSLVAFSALVLAYSVYLQLLNNFKRRASRTGELPLPGAERVRAVMRARGYDFVSRGADRTLFFAGNRAGKWGSAVFHAGLLIVIVSAFLTFAFQKRGFVQLIEGEVFGGSEQEFLAVDNGPLSGSFIVPFSLRMKRLEHEYWGDGRLKSLRSSIAVLRGGASEDGELSVNNPLEVNRVKVYQSGYYGYSLSLALKDASGRETVTHFLLDKAANPLKPAAGGSDFPTTDYIFSLKFLPDKSGGSFYPRDPVLSAVVSEKGRIVFDDIVPNERAVKVGKNLLRIADVRNWSGLIFVEDRWIWPAYMGFGVCVLGTLLMFIFPYHEMAVTVSGENVADVKAVSGREKAVLRAAAAEMEAELKGERRGQVVSS